ncbi:C45 family autoproteolytic acyltransferase/hydolase [soil metagenome]
MLEATGTAEHRGSVHGAAFHSEIQRYAAERLRLSSNGSWAGRPATESDALALAAQMLESHRTYDSDLFEEMSALAAATDISIEQAIIVGGFTDFVDVVRAQGSTNVPEEDDCTAAIVPDELGDGRGFLVQTWDMHDSATEHAVLLRIEPDQGPAALVFSTVGCLGQIGMNEAGIAIGINNLTDASGKFGVTWPFVVRKALKQTRIDDSLAAILEADLAGAHNYLLFDSTGNGFNVEAMVGYRAVSKLEDRPLLHTNHALDEGAQTLEAARPAELMASSVARLARVGIILDEAAAQKPVEVSDLMALTRDSEAICRRSEPPYHTESSGAVIMRPATGEMWACWGVPADNEFEEFRV